LCVLGTGGLPRRLRFLAMSAAEPRDSLPIGHGEHQIMWVKGVVHMIRTRRRTRKTWVGEGLGT
jgi:hypothetical protein